MSKEYLIPEWKASVDEIWAILRENAEQMKAMGAETDRRIKENAEQMKETDRRIQKTDEQLEKNAREIGALKKTVELVTKNVGGLNRSMGELIETLIAARLWEKFEGYGLKRSYPRVPVYDEKNIQIKEIDILLSDTDAAMAIEVKREFSKKEYVDDHLERMECIRKYPPAEAVGKKIFGAVAGGVVTPEIKRYAFKNGLYVLELTGETVDLVTPPDGFVPRKW